jgi:hypothetical protein
VVTDLFDDNKLLSMFKRPANVYDFKKKVLSAMKARYLRVTSRGSHSVDVDGDEDVSMVDRLAVKMQTEMTEVQDKEEATRREAELWKAQKKAVSNILVPPPRPDLSEEVAVVSATQQLAAVRNPFSVLTGNVPQDAPSLEEEMAEKVTPRILKKQRLQNNDCAEAINSFNASNDKFFATFSAFVDNKAQADREAVKENNRGFILQLLDKLEKGVISKMEFDELKRDFL